ncbi:MAG TPA: signal peptidase I [Sphingomicrobium sp.]|nr:signal peptidase I [Sphingomicrobium sp.]
MWREIKGIFWVLVAVLAFHSFIAKPFYIPSESMMPVLLKGDRLVVSKYPFGWSWVSPSFHIFPHWQGRLLGKMPERGDIVIVTPPGRTDDYIKRVIGLPGDKIEVVAGQLFINGRAVRRQQRPPLSIPLDDNVPCGRSGDPDRQDHVMMSLIHRASDGREYCVVPLVRETLPNGVTYDTIELGRSLGDDFAPVTVPADHVFLMGDNRDRSADSRFPLYEEGLGGPVPWENLGGRAEFITFSLDGTTRILNPLTWLKALRSGRAGNSLRGSAS